MSLAGRIHYYRRILKAYVLPGKSQLTFWHDTPQANPHAREDELGEYYMSFAEKADYAGHHDSAGVPMLDYHGRIGMQYNPIAIAQWGLGNYNLYRRGRSEGRRKKFLLATEWLLNNLETNSAGVSVWNHHFDWEYRSPLRAPWYSGLAQGQGISLLARAQQATSEAKYIDAAGRAFESFLKPVDEGGVIFSDERGDPWIEEYLVFPPTHILNGFIWALWGVYDYCLATGSSRARQLFERCVGTLRRNLDRYDLGFWSLYEQSGTRLPMVASPFYHQLHIVQLKILARLSGEDSFNAHADRWERYARSRAKRTRALCYKGAFKLGYY